MEETEENSDKPLDTEPTDAPFDEEDALPKDVRQRIEAMIPEIVKRTLSGGMTALFSTEENIRRYAKDMKLPKEVAGYLTSTAGATKDEMVRIIGREVREFLENVNLSEEIARMLTTLSFEVKTEIRFIPNDEKVGKVQPDVKASAKLKRSTGKLKRRRRNSKSPEED